MISATLLSLLAKGGSAGEGGFGVYPLSYLLEGLRPECEAVMRALFCRVDRWVAAVCHHELQVTFIQQPSTVSPPLAVSIAFP